MKRPHDTPPPYCVEPPGPPYADGCGPAEAILGAIQWRYAEGRLRATDPVACAEAQAMMWRRGASPAWLSYAAAVRALIDGAAQVEMFSREAA